MRLSDLGEKGLHDLIRDWIPAASPTVRVGPGDDAAILESRKDRDLVVTTDAFREGVHFSLDYLSPDEIGHRAMAATLSDLAAMGAEGLAAFVNLHAPEDSPVEFLRRLYQGLDRVADSCGVSIAGGDTVQGPLALGITAIGTVAAGEGILRAGAREGDVLCVSGELGRSEAGRMLLAGEVDRRMPIALRQEAESGHRLPRPRFDVSRVLMSLERRTVDVSLEEEIVEAVRPTAMMDVSDGLAIDLRRLCEASHVGCQLEERLVPVNGAARRIARRRGQREVDAALAGGEDFELLFTIRPGDVDLLLETARKASLSISPIGKITSAATGLVLVDPDENEEPLPDLGFDHFRADPDAST